MEFIAAAVVTGAMIVLGLIWGGNQPQRQAIPVRVRQQRRHR